MRKQKRSQTMHISKKWISPYTYRKVARQIKSTLYTETLYTATKLLKI